MKLNKKKLLLFIILIFSFSFSAVDVQPVAAYQVAQLAISLDKDNYFLGDEINISALTNIKRVSFVKAMLEEGTEYYLKKSAPNVWIGGLKIPAYYYEGEVVLRVAIGILAPDAKTEQMYYERYKPSDDYFIEKKDELLIITKKINIFVVDKYKYNKGIQIDLNPPSPFPGQRVVVMATIPKKINKATLVYENTSKALAFVDGISWQTDFIAGESKSAKLYVLDAEGELELRKISLTVRERVEEITEEISPQTIVSEKEEVTDVAEEPEKFSIKGNKTIVFINKSKEGEVPGFVEEHRREESLNLEIKGKEEGVNVEAKIFSTTQENVEKQEDIKIKLYTDVWDLYLGDFDVTIPETEFTLKNKYLTGLKYSYFPEGRYFMFLNANQQGVEKEYYFYGNDSQGPYYLTPYPVILGSERVYVDGILQVKDEDYVVEYDSGKIIFQNDVIKTSQLVKVLYEYQDLAAKNIYTATRYAQSFGNLTVGLTVVDSKDSLANSSGAADYKPEHRTIVDTDIKLQIGLYKISLERAISKFEENMRESSTTINEGVATHVALDYQGEELKVRLSRKNVDEDFEPIGNSDLKKGLNEDDYYISFENEELFLFGKDIKRDYLEETRYIEKDGYYKIHFKEKKKRPSVKYWFTEVSRENRNVGVSTNRLSFNKFYSENLELEKRLTKNIAAGIRANREREEIYLDQYPYRNAATYEVYLKTVDLEHVDLTIGKEHKDAEWLDVDHQVTKNVFRDESYIDLDFFSGSKYKLGLGYKDINDSAIGPAQIADMDYIIAPSNRFKTNGNFTVESLKETFVTENYLVSKQRGSFYLRYNPFRKLRISLKYRPNNSLVHAEGEDHLYQRSEVYNTDFDFAPISFASLKYSFLKNYSLTKDTSDTVPFRLSTEDESLSDIYILKLLPHDKVDLELKYRTTSLIDVDLNDTDTANVYYIDGSGEVIEKAGTIYWRPNRSWLLSFKGSNEKEEMTYINDTTSNIKQVVNTIEVDSRYKLNNFWTLHVFASRVETKDELKPTDNVTWENKPGIGVIYRKRNFRASLDYENTTSVKGEEIRQHKYILSMVYDYNRFVHFLINAEHINSEIPNYETTDVLAKFSATF